MTRLRCSQELKDAARKRFEGILSECIKILGPDVGEKLRTWGFGFDRAVRRLGRCSYGRKMITISEHLLRGGVSDAVLVNTMRHEIAHAVTPNHGHGKEWKAMAKRLGCDGKRCSVDNTLSRANPLNLKVYCIECGKTHKRCYRRPSSNWLNKYRCPVIVKGEKCLGRFGVKNVKANVTPFIPAAHFMTAEEIASLEAAPVVPVPVVPVPVVPAPVVPVPVVPVPVVPVHEVIDLTNTDSVTIPRKAEKKKSAKKFIKVSL